MGSKEGCGGQLYLPAGHSQRQPVGQALAFVLPQELRQAGVGRGLAAVQPAGATPDPVMPHGLPVPHCRSEGGSPWAGVLRQLLRSQPSCPEACPAPRHSSQGSGTQGQANPWREGRGGAVPGSGRGPGQGPGGQVQVGPQTGKRCRRPYLRERSRRPASC